MIRFSDFLLACILGEGYTNQMHFLKVRRVARYKPSILIVSCDSYLGSKGLVCIALLLLSLGMLVQWGRFPRSPTNYYSSYPTRSLVSHDAAIVCTYSHWGWYPSPPSCPEWLAFAIVASSFCFFQGSHISEKWFLVYLHHLLYLYTFAMLKFLPGESDFLNLLTWWMALASLSFSPLGS